MGSKAETLPKCAQPGMAVPRKAAKRGALFTDDEIDARRVALLARAIPEDAVG